VIESGSGEVAGSAGGSLVITGFESGEVVDSTGLSDETGCSEDLPLPPLHDDRIIERLTVIRIIAVFLFIAIIRLSANGAYSVMKQ